MNLLLQFEYHYFIYRGFIVPALYNRQKLYRIKRANQDN